MTNITEQNTDLFKVDTSYALGHCVGADFIMGAGIATEFKKRFKNQKYLIENNRGVGTCILLDNPNNNEWKNIFYLVTKPYSRSSKPTYESLELSLKDMFQQIKDKNIKKIAIPKIGCGLDGLEWNNVKEIIQRLKPDDLEILICVLVR